MDDTNCIFCKIAKGDIPAKKVFEDGEFLAFWDIKPQAPVHVIIIPKTHIERISDLDESHAKLAGRMVLVANDIAGKLGVKDSGYRLVTNCNKDAGQEVFHIHTHLLGGRAFKWPPG